MTKKAKPAKAVKQVAPDPPTTLKAAVKEAVVEADGTPKEATQVAAELKAAMVADPALMNATNQEPWWQSGVGFFGSGGLLWSIGIVIAQVGENGLDAKAYDFQNMVTALGSLALFAGVLYRRFMPGLLPMFHSWRSQ